MRKALALAVVLCGCVKYHPGPLDPPRLEREFRERRLKDVRELDLDTLVRVAGQYHPDLAMAKARVETAEAAILTARARPNPSLALGAGGTNAPESPVVFHFEPGLLIETARKRDYRILRAQKLAEAARLELAEASWRVRSRLRAALVERVFALRMLELLREEERARVDAVAMLEKRLAAGEIARPLLDAAKVDLTGVAAAAKAAEGRAQESLVSLAAAAGVTRTAIEQLPAVAPPVTLSLAPDKVQEAGLLHRIDVRRALLEYAAAEASLQLEIARQYPDIELRPGYSFDEGHYKIAFGPALALPVFNRNRGRIAEAEARRHEAEVRFVALQAQAIAEMDGASARYRAALAELAEASARVETLHRQEQATQRAVEAGEEDRLALAGIRVQAAAGARLQLDALRKMQAAMGALEDAVQRPLTQKEGKP